MVPHCHIKTDSQDNQIFVYVVVILKYMWKQNIDVLPWKSSFGKCMFLEAMFVVLMSSKTYIIINDFLIAVKLVP